MRVWNVKFEELFFPYRLLVLISRSVISMQLHAFKSAIYWLDYKSSFQLIFQGMKIINLFINEV